jgi:Fe-S-cluster containining protein
MSQKYDPHKKYVKIGECTRCGACCDLSCPELVFVALRNIMKGEEFLTGTDNGAVIAVCKAWDTDKVVNGCTPELRRGFPFDPWQTPRRCSYKWVEAKE